MKKETFIKLVVSLIDAQNRREKLNSDLCKSLSDSRDTIERPDFHDLIYDYQLEDSIIEAIELEFGAYGRDRTVNYIYEKNVFMIDYYDTLENLESLYDDIIKNVKK